MDKEKNSEALTKRIWELEKQLQLTVDIFEKIEIGLFIYELENVDDDRSLRMVMANQASERFTGVKVKDVIGRTLDENYPELRQIGIPQLYAEVVRMQQVIDVGEVQYGDKRVKKSWFAVKAFPLAENFMGVSFNNISDQKKMDKELRQYQNRLRSMATKLIDTEERERRIIATELHDHIGQSLAFTKIKLAQLNQSGLDPAQISDINKLQSIIAETIAATRSLTFEISPTILYELGLQEALEGLFDDFQKQYAVHIIYKRKKLSKEIAECFGYPVFRAVREILLNFIKYAETQEVVVSIREEKENLRLVIEDQGVGFDVAKINPSEGDCSGLGLFSIRERINHLGGKFEIMSKPGHGSRFTLLIPLP